MITRYRLDKIDRAVDQVDGAITKPLAVKYGLSNEQSGIARKDDPISPGVQTIGIEGRAGRIGGRVAGRSDDQAVAVKGDGGAEIDAEIQAKAEVVRFQAGRLDPHAAIPLVNQHHAVGQVSGLASSGGFCPHNHRQAVVADGDGAADHPGVQRRTLQGELLLLRPGDPAFHGQGVQLQLLPGDVGQLRAVDHQSGGQVRRAHLEMREAVDDQRLHSAEGDLIAVHCHLPTAGQGAARLVNSTLAEDRPILSRVAIPGDAERVAHAIGSLLATIEGHGDLRLGNTEEQFHSTARALRARLIFRAEGDDQSGASVELAASARNRRHRPDILPVRGEAAPARGGDGHRLVRSAVPEAELPDFAHAIPLGLHIIAVATGQSAPRIHFGGHESHRGDGLRQNAMLGEREVIDDSRGIRRQVQPDRTHDRGAGGPILVAEINHESAVRIEAGDQGRLGVGNAHDRQLADVLPVGHQVEGRQRRTHGSGGGSKRGSHEIEVRGINLGDYPSSVSPGRSRDRYLVSIDQAGRGSEFDADQAMEVADRPLSDTLHLLDQIVQIRDRLRVPGAVHDPELPLRTVPLRFHEIGAWEQRGVPGQPGVGVIAVEGDLFDGLA